MCWFRIENCRVVHEQTIQSGLKSLWGIAWLICMQNVWALRLLGKCSTRCHLEMQSLGTLWYWNMWNVGKGRRHWIYFKKCSRRVCVQPLLTSWQCWMHAPRSCPWRGQVCSWADHSKWLWVSCYLENSLVDMYAKCGSMEDHWRLFKKIPSGDVVTWTSMILGNVKCGQGQKALKLFWQMQQEHMQPDSVTFVGVLNVCASVVAIEDGRCAHEQIIRSGWDSNVFVENSLVEMYAKCGSMEKCLESVQQDAISRCGHLECHTWRMCHARAW